MLTVLSLGAGVQSTTLARMAAAREITPMPDCGIFADTQREPLAVYEHLERLEKELPFPVYRVSHGDLWASASTVRRTRDGERTYISTGIPVYLAEGLRRGIGKRQCTRTFKVDPITRKLRELLGLPRISAKSGPLVEMWLGISEDESHRMRPSAMSWISTRWPLIEKQMDRHDCLQWNADRGFSTPPRSACTFCPFHSDGEWLALTPEEFADAKAKELELQAAYERTTEMRGKPFFHASRVPLGEVKLVAPPVGVRPEKQYRMFGNDCEGLCGV